MKENIQQLLEKYNRNACSEEEIRMLETWFVQIGAGKQGTLPSDESIKRMFDWYRGQERLRGLHAKDMSRSRVRHLFTSLALAAMLLLFCGLVIYIATQNTLSNSSAIANVGPGGNKAFLTLATGERIILDDTLSGIIIDQPNVNIFKDNDGSIIYSIKTTSQGQDIVGYNTLETPKGGQFRIVLPDGSKAWLNASSSLTFPVNFSPTERKIKVSGEVFFDVARKYHPSDKEKTVPFLVETSTQIIEVLGTQFNVYDYPEESAKITLVEGKVKLTGMANGRQIHLKPGQQAQINESVEIVAADLEKVLAWKNGDFIFKNEQLSNILRQVSRWYDIEISCPDHLASREFSGMVSRKKPLSSIIRMIESTGTVKVRQKERGVTVIE